MLKTGLIVGSTRQGRFADVVVKWVLEGVLKRDDLELIVLDLREFRLPFFNEPIPPSANEGVFTDPAAVAWAKRVGELDAFIAIAPEYNHGPTAVLKNAFDSALREWHRKPIAFVSYGGVGGARAIEQLRGVAIELQMARGQDRHGALPGHLATRPCPERLRLSRANPGRHARSPGVVG
jgi:NAD(P)H-dependent FMN reductase